MADLFDYLDWRGDITFEQVPFGKVDALLFSHIEYLKFYGLVSEKFDETITFEELGRKFAAAKDYKYRSDVGMVINPRTAELFLKCSKTLRYKDVLACGFRDIYDEEKTEQFSGITFIADKKPVIVFKGTDDTIVGWKEDFNIAWMEQIPSQKDALLYLEDAAKNLKGSLILNGHSKAGNLAVYCGVKCGKKLQNRIERIYNFDGTGFPSEFYKTSEFLEVKDRLLSFYPAFSIVGMIFCHPENFEIIKSEGIGVWQHDGVRWHILGGSFENEKDFTSESKFFHRNLNNWLKKLPPEEIKNFVLNLFSVVEATGCRTNSEINKKLIPSVLKMIGALSKMDKDVRDRIFSVIHELIVTVKADLPAAKLLNRLQPEKLSEVDRTSLKNLSETEE